jgi:rhodanese-related sulfurtransferase
MNVNKLIAAAFLAAAALSAVAPASAQRGSDRDFGGWGGAAYQIGQSVDQMKHSLANDGYRAYRSIRLDGRQYDLWSNAASRNPCVGFTSYNSRVTDVRGFAESACGLVSGGRRGIDADDLRSLRVGDAQRNLREYGYTNTRNVRIDGKQWDLWQSGRGHECIGFTSYNSRVTDVRSFRGSECEGLGIPGSRRIDARDLPGLSVDQAKRALANAGFRGAGSFRDRGQQWDLFYNESGRSRRCVGFTSYNSRVTEADEFDMRDCR